MTALTGFSPLILSIFDKAFTPQDWVAAPLSADFTPVYNGAGLGSFTVASDDDAVEALAAPGARVRCEYRHDPLDPWNPMLLMSGRVVERTGQETFGERTRTFDVVDDWSLLRDTLGWPNPAGTTSQQNVREYYTVTGPAETVVKTLVQANAVDRVGMPVVVAPDQGRGPTIEVKVRNHPLADRLFPAVDLAGVGVSVRHLPGTDHLTVDCYEPGEYDGTLTEASGVVQSGTWSLRAPTATRVMVQGPGEGTARAMTDVVDTALEAEWGMVAEIAVDARDIDPLDENPAMVADMTARGWEALAEHGPRASVSAQLAESEDFRMWVTATLGMVVPVALNGAPVITDRIRQAQVTWTADDGLLVTPHVGEVSDSPDAALWNAVANVARAQRDQNVRG